MDARVGYDFQVADVTLQLFGEIFNVTNRANFANPSGDQSVSSFLHSTPRGRDPAHRPGMIAIIAA